MSDLSRENLEQLTATITDRYRELELPDAAMPTRGMVRICYQVIAAHLQRSAIAPLRSQADDPEAQAKRQADFDAIIGELKHMAMGGIMPRMNTWDASKPVGMPKSQAVINRYRKTWGQLAEIAGLRMDKKETDAMRPVAHLNGTFNE